MGGLLSGHVGRPLSKCISLVGSPNTFLPTAWPYSNRALDETENIEPSELPFPTHCLAIALDRAMESHRGTIDEVPRAGLDEDFTLPDTYSLKFHETAIIKAKFSDGIHRVREYRVVQGLKTCVVEDDITTKHGRSEMAGGRFHSKLKVTFCRKDISVSIRFLTAHKSSLWPRATELELPNGLN